MIDQSTDVPAEVSDVSGTLELRVSDRCDRCGAQAFVITMHDGGKLLLWCAHHFREHEDALAPLKVLDRTDKINTSASVSAY